MRIASYLIDEQRSQNERIGSQKCELILTAALSSNLTLRGACKITEAVLGKAKIGEKAEFTRIKRAF